MDSSRTWAGLAVLCFGNFMIGTGTLIVPGLLPQLAEALDVSLPLAGQLVTAFAVTACVGAPLLAAATSRYDRRALLAATLGVFFIGHAAAALVSAYAPMLVLRIVTSAGAALFTAQAAAAAALLVPPDVRGRAIAFVFLGWSVASVAGLPLGAYIGATLGWRAGFALVAAGSLVGAVAVWLLVPAGLKVQPVHVSTWRAVLRNRSLLMVVGVTALFAAAGFAVFTYFIPAAHAFLGASPRLVSLLLVAFGIAGVIGNLVAMRAIDRLGAGNVVVLFLLSILTAHLLWPWSEGAASLVALLMPLWGLGVFATNSAQQARLALLAPEHAPVSIALNSSAIYLGQAAGPAAGGVLIAHVPGPAGYAALAWISVPLLLLAIGLSLFASSRIRAHCARAVCLT